MSAPRTAEDYRNAFPAPLAFGAMANRGDLRWPLIAAAGSCRIIPAGAGAGAGSADERLTSYIPLT
jgi:hypothetical protein